MACATDLHPKRAEIDKHLKANVGPADLVRWLQEKTPDRPLTREVLRKHRRECLGLPRARGDKTLPLGVEAPPPGPKPSESLNRDVTDQDIEQRMLRRFYDTIDQIPPEKIADLLIEREKARSRAPVGRKSDAPAPPELAELRDAAARALGGRPSRTRSRIRAVS